MLYFDEKTEFGVSLLGEGKEKEGGTHLPMTEGGKILNQKRKKFHFVIKESFIRLKSFNKGSLVKL